MQKCKEQTIEYTKMLNRYFIYIWTSDFISNQKEKRIVSYNVIK